MEELEKALIECRNSDFSLFYKSTNEQAEYILGVAKKIIEAEAKEKEKAEREDHIENLIDSIN